MNATLRQTHANRVKLLLPAVLAVAALLAGTNRSQASMERLRTQMKGFAVDVKKWLDDRGETSIQAVSPSTFQNLPELETNPGPGLALMLTQELREAKVPLQVVGGLGINGKLHRLPEMGKIREIKELTIAMEIVGSAGKVVYREDLKVMDKETLDLLLGRGPVTPDGASRLFKGPYGVEVLVNGQPRAVKLEGDVPFVLLKPDEEYTIRLINRSEQEAMVWVGIDGLSMFAFNEDPEPDGKWHDYHVIVDGAKENEKEAIQDTAGWYFHKGPKGSRKFQVTKYPEKFAATLKGASMAKVGMITLQFWESWPEQDGIRPQAVGTSIGTAFTQKWTTVRRKKGDLKATLTVRYNNE